MKPVKLCCIASLFFLTPVTLGSAVASDRYIPRPPVVLSPDLTAPWVMQLQRSPPAHVVVRRQHRQRRAEKEHTTSRHSSTNTERKPSLVQRNGIITVGLPSPQNSVSNRRDMDPAYLPKQVPYNGEHPVGTIIIDTNERFLYLVQEGGMARRYGVGVGKPGFEWAGSHTVTRKADWPDWRPPAEMIARERRKGRNLPTYMPGGPENPLGARALYLGSTLYRIHGTNQPSTIGKAVSSGCIRMRNQDVVDLYERVELGTEVIVM